MPIEERIKVGLTKESDREEEMKIQREL
jgi:hypothetical protein